MRNIPILRAGFAVAIAAYLVWMIAMIGGDSLAGVDVMVVRSALTMTAMAALVLGCIELAHRLHGRAAVCAKLAAAGFGLQLATDVVGQLAYGFSPTPTSALLPSVTPWAAFAGDELAMLGLALAAWSARRRLGGVLAAVVTLWPPVLWRTVQAGLGAAWHLTAALYAGVMIAHVVALMWLATCSEPAAPVPAPEVAAGGLRGLAHSLWARVIAAIGALAVAVLAQVSAGDDALSRVATVAQAALGVLLLGWFGISALAIARAAVDELPRSRFVVAGIGALWCAAVALLRLPHVYNLAFQDTAWAAEAELARALSVGAPLVAVMSITAAAAGVCDVIARGREQRPEARVAAFAAMMVGSIVVQACMVSNAPSAHAELAFMLIAGGLSIEALGLMASHFGRAGTALDARPTLPTATALSAPA